MAGRVRARRGRELRPWAEQLRVSGQSRAYQLSRFSLHLRTVSTHPASNSEPEHLEFPVEELLRRARPLPDHDEMAIEDLSEEEGEAFLAAVQS